MKYFYKAEKIDGTIIEDVMDFSSPKELLIFLNGQGIKLISYESLPESNVVEINKHKALYNKGFLSKHLAKDHFQMDFSESLSAKLNEGFDLIQSLRGLKNYYEKTHFNNTLTSIIQELENGKTLAENVQKHPKHFTIFTAEMIYSGEDNNTLSHSLRGINTFYREELEQKKKDLETVKVGLVATFLVISLTVLFLI